MTKDEMITLVQQELKNLSNKLEADDFTNACDDAARDTGWGFPVTGDVKIFWQKQRVKRHLFFMLLTESLPQFKVNQINLQHRFEHYSKIIEKMDEDFKVAKSENIAEFAGVSEAHLFGTQISAGFKYESQTGKDLTYSKSNEVIITPNEND
jgi:hypothetical protein